MTSAKRYVLIRGVSMNQVRLVVASMDSTLASGILPRTVYCLSVVMSTLKIDLRAGSSTQGITMRQ